MKNHEGLENESSFHSPHSSTHLLIQLFTKFRGEDQRLFISTIQLTHKFLLHNRMCHFILLEGSCYKEVLSLDCLSSRLGRKNFLFGSTNFHYKLDSVSLFSTLRLSGPDFQLFPFSSYFSWIKNFDHQKIPLFNGDLQ